jgi:hypothetical protein
MITNDEGRQLGRTERRANPSAPPTEALDRECLRDWEGGVSGQEIVRVLFSGPEFVALAGAATPGSVERALDPGLERDQPFLRRLHAQRLARRPVHL